MMLDSYPEGDKPFIKKVNGNNKTKT